MHPYSKKVLKFSKVLMAENFEPFLRAENLTDVIKTVMGIRIKCELEGVRKISLRPL